MSQKISAFDKASGIPNLEVVADIMGSWTESDLIALKAIANSGLLFATKTFSATPGSVRVIYGQAITATPAMTSGTLAGTRGEVTVSASCTAGSGTFLYGTQGKVILSASSVLDMGSGYACGVIGQIDISAGTTTSGHIAAVIANVFDTSNTTRAYVDCIYAETPLHGSGEVINSAFKAIGSFTQMLDFSGSYATAFFNIPASMAGTKVDADIAYAHYKKMPVICDGVAGWVLIGLDA